MIKIYLIDKNYIESNRTLLTLISNERKVVIDIPEKINLDIFSAVTNNATIIEDTTPELHISKHIDNYEEIEYLHEMFNNTEYNGIIRIDDNDKIESLTEMFCGAKINTLSIEQSLLERIESINNTFSNCKIQNFNILYKKEKEEKRKIVSPINDMIEKAIFPIDDVIRKMIFPINDITSAFKGTTINTFLPLIENIKLNTDISASRAFVDASYCTDDELEENQNYEYILNLSYIYGGDIEDMFLGFRFDIKRHWLRNNLLLTIDLHNIDIGDYAYKTEYYSVKNMLAVNVANYNRHVSSNGIINFKLHKSWLNYPKRLEQAIGIGAIANTVSIIEHDDHILLKMKPLY